jgi:hypothetical protein
MSTEPCGCQCQAIDAVAVPSHGVAFDLAMDAPQPGFPLPILTLALITAALTLAHQKRRRVPLSIREPAPAPVFPVKTFEWKLQLSPAEKRFLASARAIFLTGLRLTYSVWLCPAAARRDPRIPANLRRDAGQNRTQPRPMRSPWNLGRLVPSGPGFFPRGD